MRILIVSPNDPSIDSVPEVRFIQSLHHTSLLHGTVTEADIFATCRETAFDVIHFASHAGPEGVLLSNGACMDADTIATVARIKETKGLLFNSCEAAILANYAVRHGVQWTVSADGRVEDADAWKLPAAFYGALRNGHSRDFVGAYIFADGGNGMYGLRVNPLWLQDLQRAAAAAPAAPPAISRAEVLRWLGLAVGLSVALSWLIVRLGGG